MFAPAPVLTLHGIRKTFQGVQALDGADLEIRRGETHILLGENGAGKSTLIKILAGVFPPDAGTIEFNGARSFYPNPGKAQKAGIRVIYQDTQLIRRLTVVENIFLGSEHTLPGKIPILDRGKMTAEAQTLLDRLNLPIDPLAKAEELSAAEQRMVEIARALHQSAVLIILDEPTASLTARETGDLFSVLRALRAQGVTILYISHRLEEALQLGDRATVLRDGRSVHTVSLAEVSLNGLIHLVTGRRLEGGLPQPATAFGPELLRVEQLRCSGLPGGMSFSLRAGEIIGVTGLLGAGGTALTRALFGIEPIESGKVFLAGKRARIHSPEDAISLGIGLLPEDRLEQGLVLEMRVRHNMTLAALENAWPGPFIDHSHEHGIIEYYAQRLGIRRESLNRPAMTLSGGTQQKVVLSKWLATRARILICDDPTRGVDVGARSDIHHLMRSLARRGMGILLVSKDPAELMSLCDRVLVIRRGGVVADLPRTEVTRQKLVRLASGGGLG